MPGPWLITAATSEPVLLDEAKQHAKIEFEDENKLIESWISEARQIAERTTRRQLLTATWRLYMDSFPTIGTRSRYHEDTSIVIPRPPLQSVTNIQYVDTAAATQTLSSSVYTVETTTEPGRIHLAYGQSWPATRSVKSACWVNYVAGYTAAALIPAAIINFIRSFVELRYRLRGGAGPELTAMTEDLGRYMIPEMA